MENWSKINWFIDWNSCEPRCPICQNVCTEFLGLTCNKWCCKKCIDKHRSKWDYDQDCLIEDMEEIKEQITLFDI